jgi:hypothetical protein
MKNINEQIGRIKQLFTEERLHGNLVENDNSVLTEQQKAKSKYDRNVANSIKKVEKKLKKAKSKEEMDKALKQFKKKTSQLWQNYQKNPKGFNMRNLLFKKDNIKLYSHKDEGNELMLVSLGKKRTAKDNSEDGELLIKSYYKEKFAKQPEDITVTSASNGKFKSGKEYVIYTVIDNSDILTSEEEPETTDNSQKDSDDTPTDNKQSTTDSESKSEPEAKAEPESKSEPEAKAETPKTGDFTKPLQKLGGSQKGYTYHLVGPKKAVKKDASGKIVATYIKESTFNKKSLFESAYSFDINNTLTENWKWVEGKGGQGQTFSDNLSKKFDDAIAQIGGETSVTDTVDTPDSSKTSAAKEVPKGWDKFPCVYKHPKREVKKSSKDGSISFVIDGIEFYNNGRCYDIKTKEKRNYECNGEEIKIGNEKVEKPIDTTEKEIAFDWSSGSPGKLKVVGNHLSDLSGIQNFLDGMVDSLDSPYINLESDAKDLLNNINLIKDIKLKKRMDYHGVAKKPESPNYCKGSCGDYFWWQIPENEEGSLLSALLKAYKSDESGDTVSGDIEELIAAKNDFTKTEDGKKLLQDILNIVKNY